MSPSPAAPILGLDFDNTIVLYDAVFARLGREAGLLPAGFSGGKRAVRAAVRALPDGAARWTALQAQVYGPGIALAAPSPGLHDFLRWARGAGWRPAIVSHKTPYAAAAPDGVNLRDAARAWINAQGLTDPAIGGIDPALVFFESTRAEKIARIRDLGCRHFVDDLDEVFLEADFPATTDAILFTAGADDAPAGPWRVARDWEEVAHGLPAIPPP